MPSHLIFFVVCRTLCSFTDTGFHIKRNVQCELNALKYLPVFLNNLIARDFNIRFTGLLLSTYINLSLVIYCIL